LTSSRRATKAKGALSTTSHRLLIDEQKEKKRANEKQCRRDRAVSKKLQKDDIASLTAKNARLTNALSSPRGLLSRLAPKVKTAATVRTKSTTARMWVHLVRRLTQLCCSRSCDWRVVPTSGCGAGLASQWLYSTSVDRLHSIFTRDDQRGQASCPTAAARCLGGADRGAVHRRIRLAAYM
jgi:hypothetical protein